MSFAVITLFPDMFDAFSKYGVTGRAVQSGLVQLLLINPRDFTEDPHRTVDGRSYGGGPGMVMMAEPLYQAIHKAKVLLGEKSPVIFLSPQGIVLTQARVNQMAHPKENAHPGSFILLCGRYEGVDQRLIDLCVDEQISLGEFVVSGGELPAMMLMDAVTRLLPGALGHAASALQDSFMHEGQLDHPHYTRPRVWKNQPVPAVLLSGDHGAIAAWREEVMLKTKKVMSQDPISSTLKKL